MRGRTLILVCLFAAPTSAASMSPDVQPFIAFDAPVVAITHVRVIDGTAAPAREDQTLIVSGGHIQALGAARDVAVPAGAHVVDGNGRTVLPGLVGMHDHLFYAQFAGELMHDIPTTATRLYLAAGVTTIRTAGSMNPYLDLGTKKLVDRGRMVGPKIHVTGPYLEGAGGFTPQMPELTTADAVTRTVDFWADQGVTSFKLFQHLPRSLAGAAIAAAHRRGLKVTGHLCAVTFGEAIALGIDNLEHGIITASDFQTGRKLDVCPDEKQHLATIAHLDIASAPVRALIGQLVAHHVAITSTLAVWEGSVAGRPNFVTDRVWRALAPQALTSLLSAQSSINNPPPSFTWYRQWSAAFVNEMRFERAFVRAGGLLLAGADPTGDGGVLPGFADQREVELLVEAGFAPLEAIHIATANGALFLGEQDRIGTLAPGRQADLVIVRGNPATTIGDLEKVELVFKDGVAYDPTKLVDSVRGKVGIQ
jgi:imidazolonepropionase-like amidohydrolase